MSDIEKFFKSFAKHIESVVEQNELTAVPIYRYSQVNNPEFSNLKNYMFSVSRGFECKLFLSNLISDVNLCEFVIVFSRADEPDYRVRLAWVIRKECAGHHITFDVAIGNILAKYYQRVESCDELAEHPYVQHFIKQSFGNSMSENDRRVFFSKNFTNSHDLLSKINFELIIDLFCCKEDQKTIDVIKSIFAPLKTGFESNVSLI